MNLQHLVVIGASAGGFEAIKRIVKNLPPDFQPPVFIVWHMGPDVQGILPSVLDGLNEIPAAQAVEGEPILPHRIYVAAPDHHLLIEKGRVRVTRGPKENRFRPAVDPLFRSAAFAYGPAVIGIILSGALDDGTAGLWAVKSCGGIAVVQDPQDAEVPSMPESAARAVRVDHQVPVSGMAELLTQLTAASSNSTGMITVEEEEQRRLEAEIHIAEGRVAMEEQVMQLGQLSPFTCPECSGVLSAIREGTRTRYRCHTGHAFSADSLLSSVTANIEEHLWEAIRGVEESIMLLNHMGDHFAEMNQTKVAALYFNKAAAAVSRIGVLRNAVKDHEQLSARTIESQA